MRILVCVKRVPLTGGKIVLTADAQAIETRHLGFTISPHEECGVEEAVRIVEAIRADEAANGAFDLVFFGNESADAGNYQVGVRVAYALGRPVATGLKGVTLEGDVVRCEQEVSGGRDVYVLPLPAVITVLEGLNLPRYPSVPAKLRAQRKPVESSSPTRAASRLEKVRLVVPEGQGKEAVILGHGPEAAPAVVEVLRQIGVA